MPTTVVLPEQQRQGTFTSSSILTPVGVTWVRAEAIIPEADLANTANALSVIIEQSLDDGLTWRGCVALTWTGGPSSVVPSCTTYFETQRRLRVTVDIPVRMRVGASITYE